MSSAMSAPVLKLLYWVRDRRSTALFSALRRYVNGRVLDVGGGGFYSVAVERGIPHSAWYVVEQDRTHFDEDEGGGRVVGDAQHLPFMAGSFDSVISIQVLEHVFEPVKAIEQMAECLAPGGHLVVLVPQTSTIHMAPNHFQNFTVYWAEASLRHTDLELVEIVPLGGAWSSIASRMVYLWLQIARFPGMTTPYARRSILFYLMLPLAAIVTLVGVPLCLILSLGDAQEEPNNILFVGRRSTA